MSDSNKINSFDFFWNNVIISIKDRALQDVDQDFKESCNLDGKFNDKYKKELEAIYKEKREWLKEIYMPHFNNPLLDFHKIGAVICRSMIKNKPFKFDVCKAEEYIKKKFKDSKEDNTQWFVDNLYINYKVAFYASVGVIFLQILRYLIDSDELPSAIMLNDRGTLFFYDDNERHENFQNSTILALMKNDVLNRDFDYLTYAIMLYQLEEHNKNIITRKNGWDKL